MTSQVLQLFPLRGAKRPLKGTYLEHRLDTLGSPEQPFLYANFVSSIDGRVAVVEPDSGDPYVLEDLASGHDWRLFQELQAQADCLVTHGSYLRALAAGRFPDVLQVGMSEDARDLAEWRRAHGLPEQPDIAVVSRSLGFELPASLARHGQSVHIFTSRGAPRERVRAWQERGYSVVYAGSGQDVDGAALAQGLGELGYTCVYLMAGPELLQTVIRDGALSRLYLTMTHQVIGGEAFHTLTSGPLLGAAGRLKLASLYHDPEAPKGIGQWYAAFDLRERTGDPGGGVRPAHLPRR